MSDAYPIQISFRNVEPSESIEANIREHAEKLGRFHRRIVRCRVVAEAQHRHHQKGKLWHFRIEVDVPGGEVVINHESHDKHEHEDFYVAARDAFKAAERKLEERARRQRERPSRIEDMDEA